MRKEDEFSKKLIRYGSIMEDNSWEGENKIGIKIILLDGKKYYHYAVNGNVMDIVYLGAEKKTNRFYYSRKQKEIKQLNAFLKIPNVVCDGKKSYITLEDGREVEYTQWCSTPDSECKFQDAVLVAELGGTKSEVYNKIVRK